MLSRLEPRQHQNGLTIDVTDVMFANQLFGQIKNTVVTVLVEGEKYN